MLQKTFCHTDGVSIETEKILWKNGIQSWDAFLDTQSEINFLPQSKLEKIRSEILFSKEHLDNGNLNYFKQKLPDNELYRLAGSGKIAFVDIETTGLSKWTDDITMIGIYDGEMPHIYINGQNLEDAKEHLKQFDIIVTFNGKLFDMPFIEYKFKEKYDCIHLDLRFMLKEFGLRGGLKKIEKILGISRDDAVADFDGRMAVRLWREYKQGNQKALQLLKMYNIEDIVNLQHLLEYYIKRKTKSF